jgi:oxygen-independent coproporphyrinogen-3 oxidase
MMIGCMWTYHPELLERPVPRYTSYPTAADFGSDVGADAVAQGLAGIGRSTPLSLYVHIPFCEEICWYCGCNTARSNKESRLSSYLDALNREIGMVSALLRGKGRVRRIAFGGGSPNALDPLDFVRLLGDLTVAFGAEEPLVSLELDPRRLSAGWLRVIESARVSNVSLGVQTFDAKVQQAIGRVQPLDTIIALTRRLRSAGVSSLNFDLMYGLPHQDLTSLTDTVMQVIDMRPDRVALFGYAHVPAAIARQRRIDASSRTSTMARPPCRPVAFRQSGTFRDKPARRRARDGFERPRKRERGITILAKCTSVERGRARASTSSTPPATPTSAARWSASSRWSTA